jgi:hypothetical protein
MLGFAPSSCTDTEEKEVYWKELLWGDETWVCHFEPESKQQSMQWKHTSPPPTKKLKNVPSAKKVMLILFWDINGPTLEHYMEHGQTVNSERYSAMLKDKLKPAIHSKRRGLLSKTVLLYQDNVQPHAAAATIETIQNSISNFFLIYPTLQTWHQVITTFLVH